MRSHCYGLSLALCLTAIFAAAARAQDEAPAPPPARDNTPIREADPENPYRQRDPEPVVEEPKLIREGKRLLNRSGTIRIKDQQPVFHFAGTEHTMPLLPSKPLERIESIVGYGRPDLTLAISAQVFEYRGRNYLLLEDTPRVVVPEPPEGERQGETRPPAQGSADDGSTSSPDAAPNEAAAGEDDPGRDVPPPAMTVTTNDPPPDASEPDITPSGRPAEGGRRPESTGASPGAGAREATDHDPTLMAEGTRIIDREGRIVHENGETRFIFDSGDRPIVLLANRKLERMEDLSDYGRKVMRFRVSGRVTEYRGRNYLSMTKLVIIPKAVEQL